MIFSPFLNYRVFLMSIEYIFIDIYIFRIAELIYDVGQTQQGGAYGEIHI